jgi:hypothetical protein
MRRGTTLLAALSLLAFAACGPAQAVVLAELDQEDPDTGASVTRPIADLSLLFLPYDRDQIFDSLTAAYGTPEPAIPAELLEAQGRIAALQEEWRLSEVAWGSGRDRLQEINRELEGLPRGGGQYRLLFAEFQEQETRVTAAERTKNSAFARFTALQDSILQQAGEIRVVRDNWADEAYKDFSAIQLAKIREAKRQPVGDTTDASGLATVSLPAGTWWVYARYDLPYSELYWNVRVEVQKGDPVQIPLNRANAQIRPKL